MIRRLRGEAGYSLIEMVTVMAIMGVITSGLTQIFVTASHADTGMQDRFRAQQNGRLALDKFRRDAHCAYDVNPNTPNPWTSAQETVTLKISSCTGGDVTWCALSIGGSTTRYGLYREAGSTCDATNGIKIADYLTSSAPFTSFSHVVGCSCLASIGINLPVSVKGSTVGAYTLQDTIYLRNSTRV